ncbi:hypothetical protein FisN_19Lh157 [Fistulifera solaris]|uniref:Uncharacterized protein n=1 Tax=Fistulifera solaris TaxID=1519565 RepID=A0A1Z5J6P9_FISSO|nr:hypothetical protein FisN_19Lh157 [Fistulifera solaris]|eukprot:GAX09684.1 hypothetical protein FisN_19Lh157 [Fistulifera solaris]
MMLAIGLPSVEAFLTRTNDSPTSSSSLLLLLQGIERRPNAIQPLSSSPSPEESSTTVRGDAAGNPQFPQQPADVGLVDRPSPPPPELLDVVEPTKQIWNVASPVTVQGRSLKTWAFPDRDIDKVHLVMKTDGRPLLANVDLWQGPRNTPQRISVYTEDGDVRPFSALIATTGIGSNVVRVVNAATLEFPLKACIVPSTAGGPLPAMQLPAPTVIQGGSLRTWSFEAPTKSVMVLIKTDGRPMNARIELLQGPNTIKQVMELYTEDGVERPFFAVMETPGTGNVVRVVNTAPMEFPLTASVEPFETEVPGVELPQSGILGGSIPKVQW